MAPSKSTTHHLSFSSRPSSHPLTNYLFRLMLLKQSNLCLSADVANADTLLSLAASIGPSIVVLKTHFDIINNWDPHPRTGTGAKLAKLARQHGFLIFEDRKFSDIGSTVQKQYTDGPGKIVEWAHITNAHILPGPAIVTALDEAASKWRERKKYEVKTNITVGTPRPESLDGEDAEHPTSNSTAAQPQNAASGEQVEEHLRALSAGRKSSIVSITTVSQHFEPVNSPRAPSPDEEVVVPFPGIEEAPLERGLLLLAQMSSAGNLLDRSYANRSVEIARENKNFVMGYIAQESLNSTQEDQFITMTPGCQLPPEEEEGAGEPKKRGDALGQQYNTPGKLVGEQGTDIVIVGRGIIKAEDPVAEAERYRRKAWEAYEERIGSA